MSELINIIVAPIEEHYPPALLPVERTPGLSYVEGLGQVRDGGTFHLMAQWHNANSFHRKIRQAEERGESEQTIASLYLHQAAYSFGETASEVKGRINFPLIRGTDYLIDAAQHFRHANDIASGHFLLDGHISPLYKELINYDGNDELERRPVAENVLVQAVTELLLCHLALVNSSAGRLAIAGALSEPKIADYELRTDRGIASCAIAYQSLNNCKDLERTDICKYDLPFNKNRLVQP